MLLSNLNLLATALGGVARLRELILTLAVQGKLVSQDAKDEPASALLKKIRAEKDRLIAEGKIKRDMPLADIGDEEKPFELPQAWEWVRIDEVAEVQGGIQKTQLRRPVREHYPYLRVANVQRDALRLGEIERFELTQEELSRWRLVAGDLLIVEGNGSADEIGRCAVWDGSIDPCVYQNHLIRVRCLQRESMSFIKLFLNAPSGKDEMKRLAITTSGLYNLSVGKIRNFVIPVPPLAEQSRIVTRVEELMRLCDALEAKGQLEATQHAQLVSTLLATLTDSETPAQLTDNWHRIATHFDLLLDRPEAVDALEQTILQLAVRGLLVPQDPQDEPASVLLKKIRAEKDRLIAQGKIKRDKPLPPIAEDEQPFALPLGWEWVRFGQIANIASNLVPPGLHATKWQVAPDCIEKATGRLLQRRTVAQAEIISPNHLFKPGQILYSKIRPSLSKAVLVDFEGLCSADMYPIESPLDSEYLLMYILSQPFLDQVSIAENRVKMPKLNQEALVAFTVALPPLAEQSRIVTRVAQLRRLCADLRQRMSASQSTQAHLAEALVQSVG
jgi:type I restriction enzyme S subunit